MQILSKILLISAICLTVAGCESAGWSPLGPQQNSDLRESTSDLPPIVLRIDVPTLDDGATFYDARVDPDSGMIYRRRTWRGPPGADVAASLLEVRRADGAAMDPAPAPSQAVANWQTLSQRKLDFQVLFGSENALGPVQWRRFLMGPRICVVFSQGVAPDAGPPTRHVMGYYCAAAGDGLSDGQAETVVRAVRVQEGDPGQPQQSRLPAFGTPISDTIRS
jgi:hypothetical protein